VVHVISFAGLRDPRLLQVGDLTDLISQYYILTLAVLNFLIEDKTSVMRSLYDAVSTV